MQKIHLFSQYDAAALFLKTRKELEDQVGQWPDEYLLSGELEQHIASLKETFRLDLPEIDFSNGRQVIVDRILPLAEYQPGMRRGVNVRVSVLTYKYPLNGTGYLLGCRPAVTVPETLGEWYADANTQEIIVEYGQYAKHPRKVILAHQHSVGSLQKAHQALKAEVQEFNKSLDSVIAGFVARKNEEVENIRRMRMMLS